MVDLGAYNQANLGAHRSHTQMDQQIIDSQVNNSICEGYGCFEKANTRINVKVGQLGTISLDLCTNCVKKFDAKETVLERVEEPFSNTDQIIEPLSMPGVLNQEND